jgi:hypothetical protein
MAIQSGTVGFHKDKHPPMMAPTGPRTFTETVVFKDAYVEPPTVVTALTAFDILNDSNARISVSVNNVSATGFELVLHTWNTTKIWACTVTWMAYSAGW